MPNMARIVSYTVSVMPSSVRILPKTVGNVSSTVGMLPGAARLSPNTTRRSLRSAAIVLHVAGVLPSITRLLLSAVWAMPTNNKDSAYPLQHDTSWSLDSRQSFSQT